MNLPFDSAWLPLCYYVPLSSHHTILLSFNQLWWGKCLTCWWVNSKQKKKNKPKKQQQKKHPTKKKRQKISTVLVVSVKKTLDVIKNVLSPTLRNLFSVFLKPDLAMQVLQIAVLSLPLVKTNTFHSFTETLSGNILLLLAGRRQHQTACQLWERNEP